MTLIEQIVSGNASDAAALVESRLNRKLVKALESFRFTVAEAVYGDSESIFDTITQAQSDKNAHEKANAATTNWGADATGMDVFANRQAAAADVAEGENDAFGNKKTTIDPSHPSYKLGVAFDKKNRSNPNSSQLHIHAAAKAHLRKDHEHSTLQQKLDAERQFKAGAIGAK